MNQLQQPQAVVKLLLVLYYLLIQVPQTFFFFLRREYSVQKNREKITFNLLCRENQC